jgi:hypothetical protein
MRTHETFLPNTPDRAGPDSRAQRPTLLRTDSPRRPFPVKVVVVTMFERGADTGDEPGEFQYWVERDHLDRIFPLPQAYHDLRMNRDGVLGMVTGMGTARAAASVMAVGLDPRFDLRHAYWLIAGIAGVDPADATLGSAAWATWIVDGDLAHEIDAREMPRRLENRLRAATPLHALRTAAHRHRLRRGLSLESSVSGLGLCADQGHRAARQRGSPSGAWRASRTCRTPIVRRSC